MSINHFNFEEYTKDWRISQSKHYSKHFPSHKFHKKSYTDYNAYARQLRHVYRQMHEECSSGIYHVVKPYDHQEGQTKFVKIDVVYDCDQMYFHNAYSILNLWLHTNDRWDLCEVVYSVDLMLYIWKFRDVFLLNNGQVRFSFEKALYRMFDIFFAQAEADIDSFSNQDSQALSDYEKLLFLVMSIQTANYGVNKASESIQRIMQNYIRFFGELSRANIDNNLQVQVNVLKCLVYQLENHSCFDRIWFRNMLIGIFTRQEMRSNFYFKIDTAYRCHITFGKLFYQIICNRDRDLETKRQIVDLYVTCLKFIDMFVKRDLDRRLLTFKTCYDLMDMRIILDEEFSTLLKESAAELSTPFRNFSSGSTVSVNDYIDFLRSNIVANLMDCTLKWEDASVNIAAESGLFKEETFMFNDSNKDLFLKAIGLDRHYMYHWLCTYGKMDTVWLIEKELLSQSINEVGKEPSEFNKIFKLEDIFLFGQLSRLVKNQDAEEPKGWYDFGRLLCHAKLGQPSRQRGWALMLIRLQKMVPTVRQWISLRLKYQHETCFPAEYNPWTNKQAGNGVCASSLAKFISKVGIRLSAKSSIKDFGKILPLLESSVSTDNTQGIAALKRLPDLIFILKAFCHDVEAAVHYVQTQGSVAKAKRSLSGCPVNTDFWVQWKTQVLNAKAEDRVLFKFIGQYEAHCKAGENHPRTFTGLRHWYLKDKLNVSLDEYEKYSDDDKLTIRYILNKKGTAQMYKKYFKLYTPKVKNDIVIDTFETDKMRIRLLNPGDKKALYIGELTGCCQHLGSVGAPCAVHSYTNSDSAVLVLESLDGSKTYAQSFVWVNQANNTLVFDSIESVYDDENMPYVKLVADGFKELFGRIKHRYNVVVSGTGYGLTAAVVKQLRFDKDLTVRQYEEQVLPQTTLGYSDFRQGQGWVIRANRQVKIKTDPINGIVAKGYLEIPLHHTTVWY